MRYVAMIPAAALVVAFTVILIGSPFSADNGTDPNTGTAAVLPVAETPADAPARLAAAVDAADDLPPADRPQTAAQEVAFERTALADAGDAVADTPPEEPTDAAPASQPMDVEALPANTGEADEDGEDGEACVSRTRRQGRRFGRCR